MALPATTHWRVRAGGNALNAGGFDPAPGDGTDYTDSDTPILSFTDLATTGAVTTVTTAAGGVTAAMKNNYVRLASGANAIPGYYKIESVTDANTFVLDRTPASGAMSGGVGRIGGAFPSPWSNLATGGTVSTPTIASPLAAGHTVWIRGSGDDDPSVADYTLGDTIYPLYPNGTLAAGPIRFRGYNGRPLITCYAAFTLQSWMRIEHMSFKALGVWTGGGLPDVGLVDWYYSTGTEAMDCIFDQAGYDRTLAKALTYRGCEFRNSGSTSNGTQWAIGSAAVLVTVIGCQFRNLRGGVWYQLYVLGESRFEDSVIAGCRTSGPAIRCQGYPGYVTGFRNCSFHSNGANAISFDGNTVNDAVAAGGLVAFNNIFSGNGGYGISITGVIAANDILRNFVDHNAFYGNTSGRMLNLSDGAHDITLSADPFTDAPGGDFTLNNAAGGGALVRDVAFPADFPSA